MKGELHRIAASILLNVFGRIVDYIVYIATRIVFRLKLPFSPLMKLFSMMSSTGIRERSFVLNPNDNPERCICCGSVFRLISWMDTVRTRCAERTNESCENYPCKKTGFTCDRYTPGVLDTLDTWIMFESTVVMATINKHGRCVLSDEIAIMRDVSSIVASVMPVKIIRASRDVTILVKPGGAIPSINDSITGPVIKTLPIDMDRVNGRKKLVRFVEFARCHDITVFGITKRIHECYP